MLPQCFELEAQMMISFNIERILFYELIEGLVNAI